MYPVNQSNWSSVQNTNIMESCISQMTLKHLNFSMFFFDLIARFMKRYFISFWLSETSSLFIYICVYGTILLIFWFNIISVYSSGFKLNALQISLLANRSRLLTKITFYRLFGSSGALVLHSVLLNFELCFSIANRYLEAV